MEKRISGHTGLYGLFGSPVGHSGSPAMYNKAFAYYGLDFAYLAFDVKEEDMPKAFEAIRTLHMQGGNFTMPCKVAAARLADHLTPAAQMVGACNAFVNEDGVITGHVTDGIGFVKNLENHGVSVRGKNAVIFGAGGAATSIQVQLALEGAGQIHIFNPKDRFYTRAEELKEKLSDACPDCLVTVGDVKDQKAVAQAIADCDIVINGTIMGMKPHENVSLVDPAWYRKDLVVADTVYNPEKTKMILEAKKAGCKVVGGAGMLLQQGAVNFKLFTGKEMPLD
ncbi:shikimate dehydrogenase [Anaerotignum lactatifermentans]|uniref:Shikimate dehydrogenase (NADP(+)) n=1 Tax=Anaerotignum lactatifermentans TaxID=160404 RepID=A0ABS2G8N8_9FIRM|nr:shikimate dehydrogenase [Anaerotignum lactatifermentans]MBM6828809.1 shikimate dehydrogenase [Anaerotignum lactatifermentans]MBM6877018.1 shikimate dehydrogenase [Anaerotignum lactatifermentans]MBM6950576.1 shikimate dehydrogenase [Anaerotignum lactatifermentans]